MELHEDLRALVQSGHEMMASWTEQSDDVQESPEMTEVQEPTAQGPKGFQDSVDMEYDQIFNHASIITHAAAAAPKTQELEAVPAVHAVRAATKPRPTRAQKKALKMVRERSEAEKINQGLADARKMLGASLTKGNEFKAMSVPPLPPVHISKKERKVAAKLKLKKGMNLFKELTHPPHINGARSWAGVYSKHGPSNAVPHDVVPAEFNTTPDTEQPEPKAAPVPPQAAPVAPSMPANIEASLRAAPATVETQEPTVHRLPSVHVPSVDEETAWAAKARTAAKVSQQLATVAKAASIAKKASVSPMQMSDADFKLDMRARIKSNPVFKHARDQGRLEHLDEDDEEEDEDSELVDSHSAAVFDFMKTAGLEGQVRDEDRPLEEFDIEDPVV